MSLRKLSGLFKKEKKYECFTSDLSPKEEKVVVKANGSYITVLNSRKSLFDELPKLGEGSFGIVYGEIRNGDPCATKYVKAKERAYRDKIKEEAIKMIKFCKNPNIVKCFEYREDDPEHIAIVMEKCTESLQERYIRSSLGEDLLKKVLTQIIDGLKFIHQQEYVHRDIKPANILFRGNGSVAITDFGTTARQHTYADNSGDVLYSPPEYFTNAKFDTKYDVWSLGVLIYEVISRETPYKDLHPTTLGFQLNVNKVKLQLKEKDAEAYKDVKIFMDECLVFEHKDRKDLKDIKIWA